MIYVALEKSTQVVYVPRNGMPLGKDDEVLLEATSTAERRSVVFTLASAAVAGDYLRLVVGLPEGLDAGEWEYRLTIPAGESTGLMQVTGDETEVLAYRREIEYKQYGE